MILYLATIKGKQKNYIADEKCMVFELTMSYFALNIKMCHEIHFLTHFGKLGFFLQLQEYLTDIV